MFQLYIYGFNSEKHLIDIDTDKALFDSMKVADLKKKFLNDTALPGSVENLRFLFAGKQLENERTIEFYKIQNRSVIMTIIRLPGGLPF